MIAYVLDFLSILFDKLKDKDKIRTIILFGSFARGEARKDSDIDLFIDIFESNKDNISSIVKESLNEFEIKSDKNWKLKGISNSIAPIVDDINKEQWKELRKEISSYGLVLYGRYSAEMKKEKHFVFIEYDLSKAKQKDKMKTIRRLFGYKIKKGKKIYEQKGILKEFNAEKIQNSVLVDIGNYKKILIILKEQKIPVKVREVWID